MVVATLLAAFMQVAVRRLSAELHPFVILFFRNLLGMFMFLPLVMGNGFSLLKTEKFPFHLLRAALNVGAVMASFLAISYGPLACVNGLSFSAPLFAAVLSVILLGERFHLRRWSAIVLGLI